MHSIQLQCYFLIVRKIVATQEQATDVRCRRSKKSPPPLCHIDVFSLPITLFWETRRHRLMPLCNFNFSCPPLLITVIRPLINLATMVGTPVSTAAESFLFHLNLFGTCGYTLASDLIHVTNVIIGLNIEVICSDTFLVIISIILAICHQIVLRTVVIPPHQLKEQTIIIFNGMAVSANAHFFLCFLFIFFCSRICSLLYVKYKFQNKSFGNL